MKESYRIAQIKGLDMRPAPRRFLTNLAQCPSSNVVKKKSVMVDVRKGNSAIAIDVTPNTGGYANNNGKYATREFTPPAFDEYGWLYADDLNNVGFDQNEYSEVEYNREAFDRMMNIQNNNRDKITRAVEKQAADALFTGQQILADGTIIDYKRNAEHTFTAASSWAGVDDDIYVDFEKAVYLNARDGLVTSDYAILGKTALLRLLANKNLQERGDLKNYKRDEIQFPSSAPDGAIYHGTISTSEMVLSLFSYPEEYLVPTAEELPSGIVIPNMGQLVPYVPEDGVFVGSSQARFDLFYTGVPSLSDSQGSWKSNTGLSKMPTIRKGKYVPYGSVDEENERIKVGMKSRPLWVPTQVDAGSAFTLL